MKTLIPSVRLVAVLAGAAAVTFASAAEPTRMLFLGNSITLHAPNASIGSPLYYVPDLPQPRVGTVLLVL